MNSYVDATLEINRQQRCPTNWPIVSATQGANSVMLSETVICDQDNLQWQTVVARPLPHPSRDKSVFCDKNDTKMKRTCLLDLPRITHFWQLFQQIGQVTSSCAAMPLVSEGFWPGRNFVKYFFETTANFDILISVLHCRKPISPSLSTQDEKPFFENLILLNDFARSFVMLSQVGNCNLCSSDDFLHCPLHMSCCMHWFLARNANPVFVSEVSCCFIYCHTEQLFDIYLTKNFIQTSFMFYHLVANTMITPVEILCTTLSHSSRTSYSNST